MKATAEDIIRELSKVAANKRQEIIGRLMLEIIANNPDYNPRHALEVAIEAIEILDRYIEEELPPT